MASFGTVRLLTGKKSEKQLLGVCPLPGSDQALLSLDSEVILLQPYDGKVLRSWNCSSTKGRKLTGTAVFSEEEQEFVFVQNRTTLRTLKSTDFEQTETFTVQHQIHCLNAVPYHEPVVILNDGSLFHLGHVLEDPKHISPHKSVPIKVEKILEVNSSVLSDGKLLTLSICKVKDGYELLAAIIGPDDDDVSYLNAPIECNNCTIVAVTALHSARIPSFAAVLSDGSLTRLKIYATSQFLNVESDRITSVEVNKNSGIVSVSEDQVIVLASEGKLLLIDMKFGSVLEKVMLNTEVVKMFTVNDIIYLDTLTSVQKIQFTHQKVTLAKAIVTPHDDDTLHVPLYANWSGTPTETALFTKKDQDLVAILLKTKQEANFERSWMELWNGKSDEFRIELCQSHVMRNVLSRFGTADEKKNFWPCKTLRKIVNTGFVNGRWCSGLVSQLLSKEDWDFAYECITKLCDIPERLITRCITSLIDRSSSCDADLMECEVPEIQLPEKVFQCLKELLQLPYTEHVLRDEIASMPFSVVQNLISYLTKLLEEMSLVSSKPTLNQVICWLSLLIDAHISEIIMLENSWPTIMRLQEAVELQSAVFKELTAISRLLTQIECKLPQTNKKRSLYTVEIMQF